LQRCSGILQNDGVKLTNLSLEFSPRDGLHGLGVAITLFTQPRDSRQCQFVQGPSVLCSYLHYRGNCQTTIPVGHRNHQGASDFAVIPKIDCPDFTGLRGGLHSSHPTSPNDAGPKTTLRFQGYRPEAETG
jgi:hypothetical protein